MSNYKLPLTVILCAVVAWGNVHAAGPRDKGRKKRADSRATAKPQAEQRSSSAVARSKRVPRFEDIAFDARPEHRWLHEMLSKPVPALDFPGENPLPELLDAIAAYDTTEFGTGAGPDGGDFRMTFYPDVAELDLEEITSLEDVVVRDILFQGMTLRNALSLIFEQTTDPQLTYIIENQVIRITTRAKAESEENLVTRMYNVGELADLDYGDFPVLFNGSVPRKDVAQNDAARAGRCGLLFGALAATGCREKTGGR